MSSSTPSTEAEATTPKYPTRIFGVPTRTRVFFGWYIVAAGSGIQILISALMNNALGAYATALTNDFGWSRSSLSLAFSFTRFESAILGPLQGWMIDYLGPKTIMRVGLTLLAVGLMLFSQLQSLWQFYAFFALVAVGASLGGFLSVTVAVVNWFNRSRARALGLAQTGNSIGGLLAAGVTILIIEVGWRQVAFGSGLIVLLVGIPLTFFIVARPEDIGMTVDGIDEEERARLAAEDIANNRRVQSSGIDFSARDAMRTRSFWTISLGHASALFVVGAVNLHLILYLTDSLHYSAWAAGAIVAILTSSQFVGQIAGASLGDVVSKRLLVIVCMWIHAIGMILLAHVATVWAVVMFASMHGLAWGTRGPLMQAMRADYFGRASFGKIMGFSSTIVFVGVMSGQILPGVFYDRTGSYELGFTIVAAIAAAGSVFFLMSTRPAAPASSQALVEDEPSAGA